MIYDVDITMTANRMSACLFLFLKRIDLNFRYGKYQ